nr:substrate-binding domain-containing protein [Salmonella enterica]
MTNSNRIKLTWISFLSYALTGALVIVTGMVMGNIADYFHLPVSSMSNTFTFLNAGILISIFLNAWLMEIVPLKTQLRFGFILMVLAVAGLMFSHSLALFSAAMFVLVLIDTFASGAVRAFQEQDIAIPEQMRVVTRYDGIRARESLPPLTAVNMHLDEVARQAITLLFAVLSGEKVSYSDGIMPELVVRASTCR